VHCLVSWLGPDVVLVRGCFLSAGVCMCRQLQENKEKRKKITHGPRDIIISWALLGVGPLSNVASPEGLAGAAWGGVQ
jgi:hypothetical protein